MQHVDELTKEHTVDLANNKAHYYEAGRGYPTIFLHGVGFTSSAADWFPCIQEGLGDVVHVYAVDQLGWSPVERPVRRYEFGHLVDHVREIQDVLGYAKTNIVGHSLGGWVGGTLAYESPERVNKLVFVANAGLNLAPPPNLAHFNPPSDEQLTADAEQIEYPELRSRILAERLKVAHAPGAIEAYRSLSQMFTDVDMRKRYFLTRRLEHIKAPTLLVFGEHDLIFPPVEGRLLMHEKIVDSQMTVLSDTGHLVPTQRPRELTKLLKAFLAD